MSRVHDALRRAEQLLEAGNDGTGPESDPLAMVVTADMGVAEHQSTIEVPNGGHQSGLARPEPKQLDVDWRTFLSRCKSIPFRPAPETHLIDVERPHEVPCRRIPQPAYPPNHLQSQQDLHSIVVTSASPAEARVYRLQPRARASATGGAHSACRSRSAPPGDPHALPVRALPRILRLPGGEAPRSVFARSKARTCISCQPVRR